MAGDRAVESVVPHLATRTGVLAHLVGCRLVRAFEEGLRPLDLTSRSYFLLAHIDQQPPPSQQDLARRLMIDPTTIVTVVDELERLGYLLRVRSPRDRRRYELHLTPAGRDAMAVADKALEATEAEFFAPLSAAQQRQFHATLDLLLRGH
jgi:DNA-binding MarR family transcriptional regulator